MAKKSDLTPTTPAPLDTARDGKRVTEAQRILDEVGSGVITGQATERAVVRTRRALRAVAPVITEALVDKALKGRGSPVDTKAAMFLLTASGVAQPGAPLTEEERRKLAEEDEAIERMSTDDIARKVHDEAGIAPLPELDE